MTDWSDEVRARLEVDAEEMVKEFRSAGSKRQGADIRAALERVEETTTVAAQEHDRAEALRQRVEELERIIASMPSVEICHQNRAEGRGPCGACALCCKEQRERAERAEAEARKYHDALVARHGGEPTALLEELDEARAEVGRLRSVPDGLQRPDADHLRGLEGDQIKVDRYWMGWTDALDQVSSALRGGGE